MLRNAIWDIATLKNRNNIYNFELERDSYVCGLLAHVYIFFLWFFELGEGSDRCDKSELIVKWNGY
jgi:hypothetical protein